jgi:hypothetical protein
MRWLPALLLVSSFAVGCSDDSTPSTARDGGTDAASNITLPDVPPGCPPGAGNELGIGTPCTATGTECTGGLQCSCKDWFGYKMPPEMPCFCTSVAFGGTCESCGSSATCCSYSIPIQTATINVSACFPAVCAPGNQCPSIQP